jgi:acyl carrier protein
MSSPTLTDSNDFARAVREILANELLVEVDSPDTDLLKTGLLDSLTLMRLLAHLEERFEIRIPVEELEIDDFRSVASIARLLAAEVPPASPVSAEKVTAAVAAEALNRA